jgi:hypothetical protein
VYEAFRSGTKDNVETQSAPRIAGACQPLPATGCAVAAAAEEAGEAEQVPKVVPGSVVVDLIDAKVAFK